ncbi:MAG: cupin domain-containing protein [Proteobacteria bacterium]|nr:cupin domain-containing protein [Pseudomonadota bacterium]
MTRRNRWLIAGLLSATGLACGSASPDPIARAVAPTPVEYDDSDQPGPAGPDRGDSPAEPAEQPEPDQLRIASIEKAVNETRAARHACWAYAAADNYRVEGRLVLGLVFGQGDTAAIEVVSDQPGDSRLTSCLTELYRKYRWPAGVFGPGNRVELPFSFRAPRYQYTVRADHVEPRAVAGGKLTVRVLLDEENTGNGAAALSLLTITGELDVPVHRHNRSAEVLYILGGRGRLYSLDGVKRGTPVGPGQAIYIPAGTAHGFVHEGAEPCVLVQLYAPSGPEKRFKGSPPVDTVPVAESELRRPPRSFARPMVIDKPAVYPIAGGAGQVAIYGDEARTGDKAAYIGVLTAQSGVAVPLHRHPGSTEIILALDGDSVTTIDGDSYPVGPMTAVQIPAGIEHGMKVTGSGRVRVIQFYSPAGPEQRFKKAASR